MIEFRFAFVGFALLSAACASAPGAPAAAQAQALTPRARADAMVTALSSGAAAFEDAARTHYTPELFARRTPADRAQLAARIAEDFGRMEIVSASERADGLRLEVRGQHEATASLDFTFDAGPEHRIARLAIEASAGGGGGLHGPAAPRLPPPPINAQMSAAEMEAGLESWFGPMIAHDDFSGMVMIARDGRPYATRVWGDADRATHAANNADTSFNIGSIGKKFTQTAIARLIQEGRLTRSSTLGELLPDYPNAEARAATIDQLINMRGGISDFFGAEFDAMPKAQFVSNHAYYEFVSRRPQRFAPGARNEYCNGCYIVLGEIVERLSGMRFEDYVQRHVFAPAGMRRSGYFRSDALPANSARGYDRSAPGAAYVDTAARHGLSGSGAGGVYSTTADLLAFDNALRDGRLLNATQSAWVLGGETTEGGRNMSSMGIAGGAPGTNAILSSDGHWSVIVTSNVSPPLAETAGGMLGEALGAR
jgi:CubicO group peptidase (beta-lactamase class C family)